MLFHINDSGAMWHVEYDLKQKMWSLLLSLDKHELYNWYFTLTKDEQDRRRQEFVRESDRREAIYEAEYKKRIEPLLKHREWMYHGFPENWQWSGPMPECSPSVAPEEARFFDIKKDGVYVSKEETWAGGWYGGEKSRRVHEAFVGTMTFYFNGKPIIQDPEEQMSDYIHVSQDFKTVIYVHRGPRIVFDIIDLTQLWKEVDLAPGGAKRAVEPAGH